MLRPLIYTPSKRADEYARSSRYPDDKPIAANPRRGCTHGCIYCYAPSVLRMSREEFHRQEVTVPDALERFNRDCEKLEAAGNRAPIFLSFTCDPYCPAERSTRLTRRMIEAAHQHGQTVNILTKGGDLASRDFDILGHGDIFGVTLTLLDGELREYAEPNAASTSDRMRVLREAFDRGIETRASFEPVLDSEMALQMMQKVAPYTNLIQVGKLNVHKGDPQEIIDAERGIDWPRFALAAYHALVGLCALHKGLRFYLKQDLREHMRIRLDRERRGDWPIGHKLVAKAGIYQPSMNPLGAVSVETENGLLGLRPDEFEWVEFPEDRTP